MKTQAEKLFLKKQSIVELNANRLHNIRGGWDTNSQTQAAYSRTTTSEVCATSVTTINTTANNNASTKLN